MGHNTLPQYIDEDVVVGARIQCRRKYSGMPLLKLSKMLRVSIKVLRWVEHGLIPADAAMLDKINQAINSHQARPISYTCFDSIHETISDMQKRKDGLLITGRNVQHFREQADVSLSDLGRQLNLDRTTISRRERGLEEFSRKQLKAIAKMFSVPPERLTEKNASVDYGQSTDYKAHASLLRYKQPASSLSHIAANNIRAIRIEIGMTQSKLAAILNLPLSTMCEYETSVQPIPAHLLDDIALTLGVCAERLFDHSSSRTDPKDI